MIHSVLTEYGIPFYKGLEEDDKITFQKRIQDYLKGRQLKSRNMDELPLEKQVLIAASAVTVTFGVPKFYYPYFNLVMVFPDNYEKLIKKRYQKDKVKMQGAIVLGLEELEKGSREPGKHFHPGFHEYAHAVYHENVVEEEGYLEIRENEATGFMNELGDKLSENSQFPALVSEMTAKFPQQFFASSSVLYFSNREKLSADFPDLSEWLDNIYKLKRHTI